jgi:nitrogen fixation/metabolism regulation signal transduction histidine kinase
VPRTLTSLTSDADPERASRDTRPPFRDNPRLILAGIGVLVALLIAILALANRSPSLSPDYLAEFVLYALIAADLTMVVALVFVLARNIVKLVVERRRGGPFARFRAKLVALLIGMTLVPAMLVLAVGSELIRTSVDRWFNTPMDQILSSANDVAADYYQERQLLVSERATRVARLLGSADLLTEDAEALRTGGWRARRQGDAGLPHRGTRIRAGTGAAVLDCAGAAASAVCADHDGAPCPGGPVRSRLDPRGRTVRNVR